MRRVKPSAGSSIVRGFLSPATNRRTDAYGGPLAQRMRFMREVMAAVKGAAGNDLAVLVKTKPDVVIDQLATIGQLNNAAVCRAHGING